MNYLKGKLTGEARSVISGLALSNDNYAVAVKLLRERFGNVQEVIGIRLFEHDEISNLHMRILKVCDHSLMTWKDI